ncbi:MAG: hypothetical protein AB8F74_22155 [Saprospiraceae bacterium]
MIETSNNSLYEKAYNPFLQGGIILGSSILIMLISNVVNSSGATEVTPDFYWRITATSMLFFALFNSIFSLSTDNINKYWMRSMLVFALMVGASALVSYFFSGQSITEAGPYTPIFIVLTFAYLLFLSIMNFMKTIVNYAEQEDWQAPKQKKKKNK